jgi:RecA-family ATPase
MSAFIAGSEYASLEVEATWLIEDLIPVGGLANLYGKPKAGKSFLALGIAEAISQGHTHFLGLPVLHHGPVAFLQLDTPRSVWLERIKKTQKYGHNYSNVYFADTLSGTPFPFNILELHQWLFDELKRIKPVLLIVDTLRELHAGDENDSSVMKNVISALNRVILELQIAALLLSHRKKEQMGQADDLMSDNRGSSYIPGKMDAIFALSKNALTFQSRAAAQETIAVEQDPDSGMVVLDREEQRMLNVMAECYLEDPGASQRKVAEMLASKLKEWKGEKMTFDSARGHVRRKGALVKPKLVG